MRFFASFLAILLLVPVAFSQTCTVGVGGRTPSLTRRGSSLPTTPSFPGTEQNEPCLRVQTDTVYRIGNEIHRDAFGCGWDGERMQRRKKKACHDDRRRRETPGRARFYGKMRNGVV
jgi:hypothetical protein